ncbi:MAG: tRNA preQ1(34) S-adenosylmethionine ribosyltransferase-isomerase QueA [Candidatus Latescibacterota bacterium]|nr:MAG: tRNA preQ1(34) S-adenosylmethionine ribosyltransferase-isomerase QueA [Candidatus Latescibacterota bacterium]
MHLDQFDYHLPKSLIAQQPLDERSASRLMAIDRATGACAHSVFSDLPGLLHAGDVLVLNRSRVIPARLYVRRATGGRVELFVTRILPDGSVRAMANPMRRLRVGDRLQGENGGFECRVLERLNDRELHVRFESSPDTAALPESSPDTVALPESAPDTAALLESSPDTAALLESSPDTVALLESYGHVPLPPYITRPDEPSDRDRYQAVYAETNGSVAAPTAGLHFTPELLDEIKSVGVEITSLVLHVGLGTFLPLDRDDIAQNKLHSELFSIDGRTLEAIRAAKSEKRRVIAVGTTVTRVLETVAQRGLLDAAAPGVDVNSETDLFIYPGYHFKCVDALITNFHLPRSSLLLLVSSFLGVDKTLSCYQNAVDAKYRFYSYGDAMFIR